ncbi:hypothetical protein BY996DRAFT_212520 [Phakopsora pachyrhizi]|nr:hypothetical protein BY996DRAFT_212520 [Phakopsora pachyrhizi]
MMSSFIKNERLFSQSLLSFFIFLFQILQSSTHYNLKVLFFQKTALFYSVKIRFYFLAFAIVIANKKTKRPRIINQNYNKSSYKNDLLGALQSLGFSYRKDIFVNKYRVHIFSNLFLFGLMEKDMAFKIFRLLQSLRKLCYSETQLHAFVIHESFQ